MYGGQLNWKSTGEVQSVTLKKKGGDGEKEEVKNEYQTHKVQRVVKRTYELRGETEKRKSLFHPERK